MHFFVKGLFRGRFVEAMLVQFVKGWTQIGEVFGVKGRDVKEWYSQGAPVVLLGSKPVTEVGGLWLWLLELHGKDLRIVSVAEYKRLIEKLEDE